MAPVVRVALIGAAMVVAVVTAVSLLGGTDWFGGQTGSPPTPVRATDAPAPQEGAALPLPQPPPAEVETPIGLLRNEPGAAPGYTLFGTWNGPAYLIDNAGRMVHKWDMQGNEASFSAKLQPDGDLTHTTDDGVLHRVDPAGNEVWRYSPPDLPHHDHLLLPNGNFLLLLRGVKSRGEVVAAGGNPAFVHPDGLKYDYIVEVRPAPPDGGEIVWQWSVWDHLIQDFDAGKPNYGVVADHPELVDLNFILLQLGRTSRGSDNSKLDWLHANAIDHHAEADQVLILARNFSEIWVVDHSTTPEQSAGHRGGRYGRGGDLLYRWGNPRAHRAGTAADQRLFRPHNAHWIAPGLPGAGNILVFNNGDEFEGFFRDHSSVLELDYPLADGRFGAWPPGKRLPPDQPAWQYIAEVPSDFLSYRLSGAQRLPNGNTLIASGQQGAIFEVTALGGEVWRYVSPAVGKERWFQGDPMPVDRQLPSPRWKLVNFLYRAVRYPPDYSGLQAFDLTPKGTIERYR